MKPKYLAITILLSVLVIGTGVIVYAVLNRQDKGASNKPMPRQNISSSDDMSTWQTYTNPDYGYQLKYPRDWRVEQVSFDKGPAGLPVRYMVFHSPDNTYQLTFGLKKKGQNIALSSRTSAAGEFVKGDPIKIGGKDIVTTYEKQDDIITSIDYSNSARGPQEFSFGDYVIYADLYGDEKNLDPKTVLETRIANKILSSLTFTK